MIRTHHAHLDAVLARRRAAFLQLLLVSVASVLLHVLPSSGDLIQVVRGASVWAFLICSVLVLLHVQEVALERMRIRGEIC